MRREPRGTRSGRERHRNAGPCQCTRPTTRQRRARRGGWVCGAGSWGCASREEAAIVAAAPGSRQRRHRYALRGAHDDAPRSTRLPGRPRTARPAARRATAGADAEHGERNACWPGVDARRMRRSPPPSFSSIPSARSLAMRAFTPPLGWPRRLPRASWLALATVALAGLLWAHGPIGQWADYHAFADDRAWLGLRECGQRAEQPAVPRGRRLGTLAVAPGAGGEPVARCLAGFGAGAGAHRRRLLGLSLGALERQPGRRPAADRLGLRRPGLGLPRRTRRRALEPGTHARRGARARHALGRLLVADRAGRPRRSAPLSVRPVPADAAGAARPGARSARRRRQRPRRPGPGGRCSAATPRPSCSRWPTGRCSSRSAG